jgi:N5-(cytidine 5'-diphosphoramidyl)-L-glutamine hydrolase
MNDKPLKIAISFRITNAPNYDEIRDSISHDWSLLLKKIGIIPIFVPNVLSDISSYLDEFDISGIILSGGDNFGDTPQRDYTEINMIEYGIQNNLPILGICRGMQILNRHFGGAEQKLDDSFHIKNNHDLIITHENFKNILGTSIQVNSYHANIITLENLGKDLQHFAFTKKDDTVEGFIHKKYKIIGIMWHPERKNNFSSENLIQSFFNN